MLQEMRDSCAMKHASADATLHALMHEKRHRLKRAASLSLTLMEMETFQRHAAGPYFFRVPTK